MPKGGVLINTARKEVIDEDGLQKALRERPDLKYVADVKPDNADALLEEFPGRVFFTPKKMGAQTAEANINAGALDYAGGTVVHINAGIAAARQIAEFFETGAAPFRVNK